MDDILSFSPVVSTTYRERVERMSLQSIEEKAKAKNLRGQTELAKLPIVGSRKSLIRTVSSVIGSNDGLVIGDQRDPTKWTIDKRAAQQVYKEQLRKDIEIKALHALAPKNSNKVSKRQISSEEKVLFSSSLIIGKNKETEEEERRIILNQLKAQAQNDISENAKYKMLEQKQLERLLEGKKDSNDYQIGTDEDSSRIAQKEARKEHFAKLTADRNRMPISLVDKLKLVANEEDNNYLNGKGFQIGELSSDGDKVMLRLHAAQKFTKQTLYRQALYNQQTLRAQIDREQKFVETGDISTGSVPYMR